MALGTTTGPPSPPRPPPGSPRGPSGRGSGGTLPPRVSPPHSPSGQLRSPLSTVRVSPPWVTVDLLFGTARKPPLCCRGCPCCREAPVAGPTGTRTLALQNQPDLGDNGTPQHGPGAPGSEDRGCPEHLPGCRVCSVQRTVFVFPPTAGF